MASKEIIINLARLSYPVLDEPQDYQGNKKFRWAAGFWIPKTINGQPNPTIKLIDETIRQVAKEEWPGKPKDWNKILPEVLLDKKGCCWIDGARRNEEQAADYWTLTAYRDQKKGRPLVYDSNMEAIYAADNTLLPGKAGRLYAGCYVKGKVEIWAQDNSNGYGIRAGLLVVQRIKDGDSFGGGRAPTADGFGAVEEGADADDIAG